MCGFLHRVRCGRAYFFRHQRVLHLRNSRRIHQTQEFVIAVLFSQVLADLPAILVPFCFDDNRRDGVRNCLVKWMDSWVVAFLTVAIQIDTVTVCWQRHFDGNVAAPSLRQRNKTLPEACLDTLLRRTVLSDRRCYIAAVSKAFLSVDHRRDYD